MSHLRKHVRIPALAMCLLLLLLTINSVPAFAHAKSGEQVGTAPSFVIPACEAKAQQKVDQLYFGIEFVSRKHLQQPDVASRLCLSSACLHVNSYSRNVFYVLASINAP